MKQVNMLFLIVFFILVLAGCSSDSDDGGGTAGGSDLVPLCQRDAGVYKYSDGSSFNLKPDCSFIFTDPNGYYGHGRVISISDVGPTFTADFAVDTGPNRGICSTISATPTSFAQTNIIQCK